LPLTPINDANKNIYTQQPQNIKHNSGWDSMQHDKQSVRMKKPNREEGVGNKNNYNR